MNVTTKALLGNACVLMLLAGTLSAEFESPAMAESLFRAGISHQTAQPYMPRSLFSIPRPKSVGDMVTINISETTTVQVQNNSTISKETSMTENTSTTLNGIIKRIFGVKNLLPTIDGVEDTQEVTVTAQNQKIYTYTDTITCQVVQVLPNGNLVVQGKKTIQANMEQQDLLISGIVNPYYLDSNNSINSQRVGNLQMQVAGRGPLSRPQGDGVLGKYMQYLH